MPRFKNTSLTERNLTLTQWRLCNVSRDCWDFIFNLQLQTIPVIYTCYWIAQAERFQQNIIRLMRLSIHLFVGWFAYHITPKTINTDMRTVCV